MKTICIIPARGGSKGLPGKNIKKLIGKPLISYTIEAAIQSESIDNIFVSTDSQEIADQAVKSGADVPFLRDSLFAQDETTMEETLKHALDSYEEYKKVKYDIAVFLTPTDIFRKTEWIRKAITLLKDNAELESAFTANVTFKNFWEELPLGGFQRIRPYMQIYGQRQERFRNKRVIYQEDTGIVCASRAWLWRDGRRIGDKVEIIPIDTPESKIDIHTEFDFYIARCAMKWLEDNDEN